MTNNEVEKNLTEDANGSIIIGNVTYLSLKSFAESVKMNPDTIRIAIRSGRLNKSVTRLGIKYYIDPITALNEWKANVKRPGIAHSLSTSAIEARAKPKSEININPNGVTPDDIKRMQATGEHEVIPGVSQLAVSKAKQADIDAQLSDLELQKELGKLVSKEDVEREAFEAGAMIREALFNLPSKLCNQLAGMTDSKDISIFLEEEIRLTLEALNKNGMEGNKMPVPQVQSNLSSEGAN